MRVIREIKQDFNTLVTRGKLQTLCLQALVDSIKKHAEQTKSQELKTTVNQIEEKVDFVLEMFFTIPKLESLEFTQLFCFQLRKIFRWETVQWEYGIENKVSTQSKEMRKQAQILANLYDSKVRLLHVAGKSVENEFKANEKGCKVLGVYSPVIM